MFVADVEHDNTRWQLETLHPFFEIEVKRQMIMERVKGLGASTLFLKLVLNLLEIGHIRRLRQVQLDYTTLMKEFRREFSVQLITPVELTGEDLAYMKTCVQNDHLRPGDTMIFSHSADPSITSGFRVVINGVDADYTWNAAEASYTKDLKDDNAQLKSSTRKLRPSSTGVVGVEPTQVVPMDAFPYDLSMMKELVKEMEA